MKLQLPEFIKQYHTFEVNQVLTKDQLNEVINYFDIQDRLSRVFLSGVGIVCGFQLKFNPVAKTLTISQGTGVTTDGDLLKLYTIPPESRLKSIIPDEIVYTHYKSFEDKSASYSFFKKQTTIDGNPVSTPIELIELLHDGTAGGSPIGNLSGLTDKVVLLYLESYQFKGNLCTAIDCDNQGNLQVANMRVLLVSKVDAAYIESLDSIFKNHNIIDDYFGLPDVAIQRVVLNKVNTANYSELKIAYYKAMTSDNLGINLVNGIKTIVNNFKPILKLSISNVSLLASLNKLQSILKLNPYNLPLNIQYRYDFLKDIVDTYNEIKSLLLSLKEECCPNVKAFPKHLLLGNIDEVNEAIKHNRHGFYKSPILNCGSSRIKQCSTLIERLFEMIDLFSIQAGEVKITPSNKLVPLSFRSIPFYYDLKSSLLDTWNYFKTEKVEQGTNLSYHTTLLSDLPHIKKPLAYNIDKFDFLRIEGHQGVDYRKAFEAIDQLKTDYGLAFDVKVLSVDVDTENLIVDDYLCEFEDLFVMLRAWTAEQECILAQISGFFSAFSTKTPGLNIKESEYSKANIVEAIVADKTTKNSRIAYSSGDKAEMKTANKEVFIATKKSDTSVAYPKAESATPNYSADYNLVNYAYSNVVYDNLTTDEDTLGAIMQVALDENKTGTVEDIIAKGKYLVEGIVDTPEWQAKPDIRTFVIGQSIEILALIHVLSQQMPQSIADMTNTGLTSYNATMAKLCKLVKKLKARYQTLELTNDLKDFMGLLVSQLSNVCCSAKKLEILAEEVATRKERILVGLQLSSFIEKHPGLEHLAGVQPGGTFVLVYINKIESVRNEVLTIKETDNSTNIFELTDIQTESKTKRVSEVNSLKIEEAKNEKFNLFEKDTNANSSKIEDFGRAASTTTIPKYTVVADFSLPYMCCSDCAPVNFIIQKPAVSLHLDQDTFCLGIDTSPLLFEVSPDDGIITSDPEVAGVTIDGNKLIFDPAAFPDEMLDKPIHFKVKEQVTSAQITVYRKIEFDFDVPDSPTTKTEITFLPTGNITGATFLWDFGDGKTSTAQNPTHKYTLPINADNKVTVSLTVTPSNGYCPATVEHVIEFKEPVPTCIEETKAAILKDFGVLADLDLADSNFVHTTWIHTSELYGGSALYKKGILNDIDNYLAGNYNNNLGSLFIELFAATAKMIEALDPVKNKLEYERLLQLLALQLQLFYNVLGCQDNKIIDNSAGILQPVLDQIIEILRRLKEVKVAFPDTLKIFITNFALKVSKIGLLNKHVTIINNEILN
jgi:hypothetical protein